MSLQVRSNFSSLLQAPNLDNRGQYGCHLKSSVKVALTVAGAISLISLAFSYSPFRLLAGVASFTALIAVDMFDAKPLEKEDEELRKVIDQISVQPKPVGPDLREFTRSHLIPSRDVDLVLPDIPVKQTEEDLERVLQPTRLTEDEELPKVIDRISVQPKPVRPDLSEFTRTHLFPAMRDVDLVLPEIPVKLTEDDLERVLHLTRWANDAVMGSYISFLNEYTREDPAVHVMNGFFATQCVTNSKEATPTSLRNLKRWFKFYTGTPVLNKPGNKKKKDLKLLKRVLMPIHHHGNHFYAVEVDLLSKEIRIYDSIRQSSTLPYKDHLNGVKAFFDLMKEDKDMPQIAEGRWKVVIDQDHPQQTNGSDCGFFTLRTLHKLALDPEITLQQSHLRREVLDFIVSHYRRYFSL